MDKRLLIVRWLGSLHDAIPIYDEASVSSARERVREQGRTLKLSKDVTETAALIASELTHNQLAHARHGYFQVKAVTREGINGLEVRAADVGPGIYHPAEAMSDKLPTANSLGAGLSGVCRLADEVEIDNRISEGTLVIARKFDQPPPNPNSLFAIMGRPFPNEPISGDDAAWFPNDSGFTAAVVDGLGHGPEARQASNRAIELLTINKHLPLDEIAISLDTGLAGTRGCALSVLRFERASWSMECISLGDVHSHLYNLKNAHFFTATPLILGTGQFRRQSVRVEHKTVAPGSVVVMFSDGLKSRTTLKGELEILRKPPIAIAEHLLNTESRPDDDALILVARIPR
jgi:anti-sigma regulatory factor (Ser/Thr protein kinase)